MKRLILCALVAFAVSASVNAAESQTTETPAAQTPPTSPEVKDPAKPEKRYKGKTQQDKTLLDSVSKTFGNAIGLLSSDGRTEGDEGVPRRIAVLPADGQGDDREREDIRTVIHNNLSSKNFDLLKPFDIDRKLTQLEQVDGKKYTEYDPQELAKLLDVEGLIYVHVPLVEKVYAAAYAHYKITVKLSFYSSFDNNFIWEKEESIAEREGGISLNPLSFIAQAISSAQVLTEAVRQTLVDKLARIFASEIPFPIGKRAKIKPLRIELALSNSTDGPFRAGDEVTVVMRAESGLAATFDLGNKFIGLPLSEQAEGEYVGRYVVNDHDNAEGLLVKINATRIDDRASVMWSVSGRINLDTTVPEPISGLSSSPVKEGVKLSWPTESTTHETLTYHVERADPQTGLYQEVAAINIQEYTDNDITEGNTYHYRVYAQDEAKNQGAYATIQVAAVGAGPTDVVEDLIADTQFYAVASPYIIDKKIRVLRGATLTLAPGTIIKFEGEGKLEVLGQVKGLGDQKSPIVITGEPWQMLFSNTGENKSSFEYTHFDSGTLVINQSTVVGTDLLFKAMKNAIALNNSGKLSLNNSEFLQNEVALWVEDGNLELNNLHFTGNKLGWKVTGRQEVVGKALYFEDNQIHIASDKPLLINNAVFKDIDYQELLSKLQGEIKIDFSGLDEKDNLLEAWLKERWQAVLDVTKAGLWREAYDGLQELKQNAPADARMNAFDQLLQWATEQPVDKPDSFLSSVEQFNKRNSNGQLWIQEMRLPYSKNIVNSDSYLIKQAAGKLTVDYLKENYRELKPAELRKYRRTVKMDTDIVDAQVLYTQQKGLFLYVWIANYLDMDKINRSLTLAGLIKRANSELTVGLLSQTDVFVFEELIVKALKKQGIKYIPLGSGGYGKPAQAKAEKMGANIILQTAVNVEQTQSGISKNLKMIDVNLILDIYDVQTSTVLDHLTASANSAGFKQRELVNKAVIESYGTIETALLSALWSADDIVAEHKKERVKREKIAAAKAEQERIAQAKAEKIRLAKEKAEQQAAAEQARLAKLKAAAEAEAEKERLAQEKAEKEAAEQQARLAKEQADAEQAKAQPQAQDQTGEKTPPDSEIKPQAATSTDINPF